jgi:UDP-glucose 4-epimerase
MSTNTDTKTVNVPNTKVLHHAAKIAIEEDCPILLDYYSESVNGGAFLGQHTKSSEKMLIKSSEEYTSTIKKIFKVEDCYIILTENSLYIVSESIKKRRVE